MFIEGDFNETLLLFSQAVATMEVAAVVIQTPVGATTNGRCPATAAVAATSSSATVAGVVAAVQIATTTMEKKTQSPLSMRALASSALV